MIRVAVEKYYTVAETALLLSYGEKWVRERIREGCFPGAVKIGADLRIPASAINGYLEKHAVSGPDEAVAERGISARSVGELRRKAARLVADSEEEER